MPHNARFLYQQPKIEINNYLIVNWFSLPLQFVEKYLVSRHGTKKERPSQNALAYVIIMFYREELIACAIDLNSSSDNFNFGFENNISDSFWIGIK